MKRKFIVFLLLAIVLTGCNLKNDKDDSKTVDDGYKVINMYDFDKVEVYTFNDYDIQYEPNINEMSRYDTASDIGELIKQNEIKITSSSQSTIINKFPEIVVEKLKKLTDSMDISKTLVIFKLKLENKNPITTLGLKYNETDVDAIVNLSYDGESVSSKGISYILLIINKEYLNNRNFNYEIIK